ncbi:hypothetical protein AB0912_05830 [Streptomyces sp. NPDC007084]|uniref:hypothetical protein n=1 Tax=Streptomyces sp. NPDC007084 TaxID=3154313 RepID=UPI003453F658
MRVTHTVLGGLAGVGWLLLPPAYGANGGMGVNDGTGAAREGGVTVAVARSATATPPTLTAPANSPPPDTAPGHTAPEAAGTTAGDLVPPFVAAGAASALAAYGYTRRRRRAATRTTPGGNGDGSGSGSGNRLISLPELDLQAARLLVLTDDCVRTSAEELGFAAAQAPPGATAPYAEALAHAETELRAAFRLRQRLDDTDPGADADDRREALEEIVTRCRDAGRRLDAAAPGFDQLRALERDIGTAVTYAETRFRELAARTPVTEATLTELRSRYAPTAWLPVAGDVEQAKDRLLFATLRLNRAHQYADQGQPARAAASLRAAEAAVAQAGVLLDGVDRLAADPALAEAQSPGTGDPVDAPRQAPEAGAALTPAGGTETPGLRDTALPHARSALAAAAVFIGTHRGAAGVTARTRLAEAERLLGPDSAPPAQIRRAAQLAWEARQFAEQDVRAYGTQAAGDAHAGTAGAVLGGVLLGDGEGPASYGGPLTRDRRSASDAAA